MNNQAAQTMPGDLRWKIDTLKPSSSGVVSLTQEEWAYVAAALSQTAGVPDVLFDGYAVYQGMTDEARARINAGGVSDVLDSVVRLIRAQAAPSASGGEVSHVTIDFPQVGTAGPFKVIDGRMTLPDVTMNDLIHHARMGYVPASNPPAGASVSERARELLAAQYESDGFHRAAKWMRDSRSLTHAQAAALRAIEQALTQQWGECVGEVANYGCAPEIVASVHWHTNVLNLPIGTKLYTIPQPSADAVREEGNG